MAKHLFGDTIDPACAYCMHGTESSDQVMILCPRFGPVAPSFHCKHFKYDPLRREPKRRPKLPEFSPDDFKLE
ncbi:MAG: hypothetical protein ACK5JF_06250 [Oscillospiraceae bacterium]